MNPRKNNETVDKNGKVSDTYFSNGWLYRYIQLNRGESHEAGKFDWRRIDSASSAL